MKLRVALDHNLPVPIVGAMSHAIVEAELRAVKDIDPRFPDIDDDAVLIHALARRGWAANVSDERRTSRRTWVILPQTERADGRDVGRAHLAELALERAGGYEKL